MMLSQTGPSQTWDGIIYYPSQSWSYPQVILFPYPVNLHNTIEAYPRLVAYTMQYFINKSSYTCRFKQSLAAYFSAQTKDG